MTYLYLFRKTLKNRIRQMLKKPGLVIAYLFFFALIFFSFFSAATSRFSAGDERVDIGYLKLFFLGYMLLFGITSISSGLSGGATIFSMADANLLFVAPLNPKHTLAFGILNQAGRSVLTGVFILFMGQTFNMFWGIGPGGLLVLFAFYAVGLMLFQLIAMVIYMFANGRENTKRIVVIVCCLFLLPTVLRILLPFLNGTSIQDAALGAMRSNILLSIPVAGWLSEAVIALLTGNAIGALLPAALCAALVALVLLLMTVGRSDYYEDVLVATEKVFARQQAASQGDINAATNASSRKVRVKERGRFAPGARAFLSKHLLESFRQNRLGLLDTSSLTFILTPVLMAFFLREAGEGQIISLLITTMMMRAFLVSSGRGLKELYSHYIFMVPAGSFTKIVWSNLELAIKSLVESVVAFVAAGIIMGSAPQDIAACIIVTAAFTLLLISVNLLSMRMFTQIISNGLLLTLYMLFIIIVMVPGIIAAAIVGGIVQGALAVPVALGILTLWELLLSGLFFFLSRGVLHTCDMETMPQGAMRQQKL